MKDGKIYNIEDTRDFDLRAPGLVGAQRDLKLKSFEVSYNAYRSKGSIRRLIKALKKGKIIISGLGGAVPFLGSFKKSWIFCLDS